MFRVSSTSSVVLPLQHWLTRFREEFAPQMFTQTSVGETYISKEEDKKQLNFREITHPPHLRTQNKSERYSLSLFFLAIMSWKAGVVPISSKNQERSRCACANPPFFFPLLLSISPFPRLVLSWFFSLTESQLRQLLPRVSICLRRSSITSRPS